MKFKKSIVGLLLLSALNFLVACASLDNTQPTLTYTIELPDPNRTRFQGKGAGAGMMLAGSMGAMGVAIGVAIDEGIAKDINDTAVAGGVNFSALLNSELQRSVDKNALTFIQSTDKKSDITIYVERYGFKTKQGDNDSAVAELIFSIKAKGAELARVHYPNAYSGSDKVIPSESLELIKQDAKAIQTLWVAAINTITPDIKRLTANGG